MITLDNCKEWFYQQPEKLTFIELNFQEDQRVLCELEKSKTTGEQWDKTVARYSDREIYKVITENVNGELHSWVYFKEGE